MQELILPHHPGEMTGPELAAAFAGRADSEIMRSMLRAEVAAIRDGADREERTLRGLWYALVKPALSRAGLLGKKTSGGKDVPWDDKLSRYLAELVRAGETSYEALRIIDGSRQKRAAVKINLPVINARVVGAWYPEVILFTEKDTIWPVVEGVASLYGVSAISGSGQPSNACTENMTREIIRAEEEMRKLTEGGDRGRLVLLSLTDYDPAGYTIAKAQFTQLQETAEAFRPGEYSIRHCRLGITPDQLAEEELLKNSYTPKDKGLAEWMEKTGGIFGQPLGLELDALPLSRIRAMFADGIEAEVDLTDREYDLKESYLNLTAYQMLEGEFRSRAARAVEAVQHSEAGGRVAEAEIPRGLFREAAIEGRVYINPTNPDLFSCRKEILAVMRAADRSKKAS